MIDVFYRIKALHGLGIRIHLHCFDYGRGRQAELEKYCVRIDYYERFLGHKGISNTLPYIVSSRKNEQLLQRLLQDDHPILMEGIHCTFLLTDDRFKNRLCVTRLHNVEYRYYRQLGSASSSLLRKMYYFMECMLLKRYEKKTCNSALCLAITEGDRDVYKTVLGCRRAEYLPAAIPYDTIHASEGIGTYCLYHGDLSVDANGKTVSWLLEKVFSKLEVPLIIAGKDPPDSLAKQVSGHANACLVSNPSEQEMQDLIAKAHINVLPATISTGMKLKLINALFNGRHCIVNEEMVAGTGLAPMCYTGTTANAFRELVAQLYHQPFTGEELSIRQQLLQQFDNRKNTARLIKWIWNE